MERMWYFLGCRAMNGSGRKRMGGEMSGGALGHSGGNPVARERSHSCHFEYKRVKRMGLGPPRPERRP